MLKINDSCDDYVFSHKGSTLIMTGQYDKCRLEITNFTNGAFSNGIKFDSRKMSYETIKTKAGIV